jgi:hypothetical protein
MSVIPLTLTISLCLVFTFVVFFLREQSRRHLSSAESEALLPLADETPHVLAAPAPVEPAPTPAPAQGHALGHVCHGNGSCNSCRRRAARQQTAVAPAPSPSV